MGPFKAPESFDFTNPNLWPEWKQRFMRYFVASKINKEEPEIQVSTLIYVMGPDAERLLASFGLSVEDAGKFDTVMTKFDEHFVPKRNIIHERARFYARTQKAGETIETYVRSLHELAAHAEFPDKNEAIRDRLVLGVLDQELSEKLQMQSDLTLEKAVQCARQSEQIKMQLTEQRHSVDAVGGARRQNGAHNRPGGSGASHASSSGSTRGRGRGHSHFSNRGRGGYAASAKVTCNKCGHSHVKNEICPARGKKCRKCGRMNHFAAVCRTLGVDRVEDREHWKEREHVENALQEEEREADFVG